MNVMDCGFDSRFKLRLDVIDVLSENKLGECADTLGAFLLRLDAIFFEYGHEQAFDAVEEAMKLLVLSKLKHTSTLIVLLRLASINQSDRELDIRERLFSCLDTAHSALAIEAYCADVNRHIWADRADLAVEALLEHFAWLSENNIAIRSNLYLEAAFTCNRFEKHLLAADFSYLAYNHAMETEDYCALDRAIFFVLNSNRLARVGGEHLLAGYGRQICKLEAGHSDSILVNQYLTPIFASYAELSSGRPDKARVNRFIGLAQEIGVPNTAYCHKAQLVASGLQCMHLGKVKAARDAYEELWCTTHSADRATDQMAELLARKLKLKNVYQAQKKKIPAKKEAWDALRKHTALSAVD